MFGAQQAKACLLRRLRRLILQRLIPRLLPLCIHLEEGAEFRCGPARLSPHASATRVLHEAHMLPREAKPFIVVHIARGLQSKKDAFKMDDVQNPLRSRT